MYESSMHTLCTSRQQPLQEETSAVLDLSLSYTYMYTFSDISVYIALMQTSTIMASDRVLISYFSLYGDGSFMGPTGLLVISNVISRVSNVESQVFTRYYLVEPAISEIPGQQV